MSEAAEHGARLVQRLAALGWHEPEVVIVARPKGDRRPLVLSLVDEQRMSAATTEILEDAFVEILTTRPAAGGPIHIELP